MTQSVSATLVKELREKTGVGMMDCKRALSECSGDLDSAVRVLREKGLASAKKRQSKTAEQGVIESYNHIGKQIGVLVEINCETDFVARNEEFLELAHEVALHVAACDPKYLDRGSVPSDEIERQRQAIEADREFLARRHKADSREAWSAVVDTLIDKNYQDHCLLEQPFVRDASISVGELVTGASARLGEKLLVRRFERFQVAREQGEEQDEEERRET